MSTPVPRSAAPVPAVTSSPAHSSIATVATLVAIAAAYFVTGHLGLEVAFYQGRSTILWAPSGIALGAVWLYGNRALAPVFVAAFAVNLWASPHVPAASLLIAAGNTTEAFIGGWLLRRLGLTQGLHSTRDLIVYFAGVVLAAPLASAAIGLAVLLGLDGLPLAQAATAALIWWLGNVGGILVIASAFIVFTRSDTERAFRPSPPVVLATLAAAALVAIGPGVAGHGAGVAAWASVLCVVLPYPVATWAALRHGMRGAVAATGVVVLAAVVGTASGAGPFQTGDERIDIAALWPLLATLSASAMLLAASHEEQVRLRDRRFALEQELMRVRSLGELGLLAGGIAHDFNNILTVISANAAMIPSLPQALQRDCVRDVASAARRGQELTQELLAHAGQRRGAPRNFDLSELARDTARLLSPHCPPGVKLELAIVPAVSLVGEPVQMRQALMNLLINAFDAMRDRRGRVVLTIGLDELSQQVIAAVSDEGPGIAADLRDRIFEPFFSTKASGHGLGLATVRNIVLAHGGVITVESDDGGTRFRIALPRYGRPATDPRMKVAAA